MVGFANSLVKQCFKLPVINSMFWLTEPVVGDRCLNHFCFSKPGRRGQCVLWERAPGLQQPSWGSENCLRALSSTLSGVIPIVKRCHRMRSDTLTHLIHTKTLPQLLQTVKLVTYMPKTTLMFCIYGFLQPWRVGKIYRNTYKKCQ